MPENLSQDDSDMPSSNRGGWWVVGQVVLFGFFIASVVFREPVTESPGLVISQIFGVLVALFGAAISVWAFRYHGSSLSPFPKPPEGMHLIDGGPYRYVRHPMYSGIIAFTLGVGHGLCESGDHAVVGGLHGLLHGEIWARGGHAGCRGARLQELPIGRPMEAHPVRDVGLSGVPAGGISRNERTFAFPRVPELLSPQ